jgi:hypothetical protein
MPSNQTIQHLEGLLEIVSNEDENLAEQTDNFIMSLKNQQHQHGKTLKEILVDNARRIFESEEMIVFHSKRNDKMGWNIIHIPSNKYRDLWIHRWLSLYILNTLASEQKIDKKILSNLIDNTSHITPHYLKRLVNANLSNANLSNANLSKADLSCAKNSDADLSYANLSGSNLSKVFYLPISRNEAKKRGAII